MGNSFCRIRYLDDEKESGDALEGNDDHVLEERTGKAGEFGGGK